tara:strand:+ start:357 stop:683 length:327 start_codon:yes stop_codon:yes gene_type:complete
MNAKELRIENLFQTRANDIRDVDIKELTRIQRMPYLYKPIPITEEWLLRLGADKSLYNHYLDFGYFDIYKLNDVWYVEKEGVTLCELKHVHQLQNLYFALTNEELKLK